MDFSFIGDISDDVGVPDEVLLDSESWERKMPKNQL